MNENQKKNRAMELYLLLLVDLLSIVAAYMMAVFLRFGSLSLMGIGELHYIVCLSCMLFCTLISLLIDWNKNFLKRGYWIELATVVKYNTTLIVGVVLFLYLTKQAEAFSRLIFGYFYFLNLFLTYLLHIMIKHMLRKVNMNDTGKFKILLVTQKDLVSEFVEGMTGAHDEKKIAITELAIMDKNCVGEIIEGIDVKINQDNFDESIRQMVIDEVFIHLPSSEVQEVNSIILKFEEMGVTCHNTIMIPKWDHINSRIEKYGANTVISYTRYNIDYRRRMIKRIMDIAGALVGLCITLVLTPFIGLAIKIDSPGPIFFTQMRVGKNGRKFKLYKFRSMYRNADEKKKELMQRNQVNGLMFKMDQDPRITKVGNFLRKSSLDELPQFYNILVGDMSLVGTRPPTVDEFEQYSLYYRRRLNMTPGLTGLWQVSGRSEIMEFDKVVELDLEYIEKWSLSVDIKILLQTIFVVILGKGSR